MICYSANKKYVDIFYLLRAEVSGLIIGINGHTSLCANNGIVPLQEKNEHRSHTDKWVWVELDQCSSNKALFMPFQLGPGRIAPKKKSGEKQGCSAINQMVTREYNINIHKWIRSKDFKKCVPGAHRGIREFAMKEVGTCALIADSVKPSGPRNKDCSMRYPCMFVQRT